MSRVRNSLIPGNGPSASRQGRLLAERGVFPHVTASNLKFFKGLKRVLQDMNAVALPAISSAFPGVEFRLDHFYLASDSPASYRQLRDMIKASGGTLLREVTYKGRLLAVLRMPDLIHTNGSHGYIYVELGEPKPERPEKNNVAHIAYSISGENEALFKKMLEKIEEHPERNVNSPKSVSFLHRDLWGDPLQLIGFKLLVGKGLNLCHVEIRRSPLG